MYLMPLARSCDCSDRFVVIFLNVCFINALQSTKMTLIRAQNIFMPANINSIKMFCFSS